MAITGSYSTSTGVDFNLVANYSYTQDTSANTSSVTVKLYLRHNTLYASALSGSYLSVAGNKVTYSKSISYSGSTVIDTLLATKTVIVKHNSTGEGSCAIKATFVLNGTYSGKSIGTLTLSKTLTLKDIPRTSSFSVPTSMNTGSSIKVSISPSSTSFLHRVRFEIDGTAKHVSDYIAAGTTSYTYTIPHSWLPKNTSKSISIYVYTYDSSKNYIGKVGKTFTANVPSSVIPTISSVKTAISSGLSGNYVQGKSQITLTVSASAGSGSSLSYYYYSGKNISGNDSSYTSTSSSKTSSVIQSSGSLTYQVRVKDARGRYSEWSSVKITVQPYASPKISSISAKRCLADGTLDNNGTYAKVTVKTTHSAINGANTATVKLTNSANDYATATQVISSTKASNTYTGIYGSGFNANTAYTISATIVDEYNATHTLSATLAAAQRALNIAKYGNGLAIGKLSMVTAKNDTPKFECNWDATFFDDVRIKHTSSRCFEWIRMGMSDDINNDGKDETADIQGQLYIANNGSVTCRRRYSTDNGDSYTAQGYWQLRNEDMYVSNPLTVTGAITTNTNFGFNGNYNDHNFNIYGQWADGSNHDILVRGTDGLSMGLGWVGNDNYETTLDIRPKKVSIRGETTIKGFRVPEIQHGNVSITPSAANTPTAKVITFKQKFSSSPNIIANGHTSVPGTTLLGVGTASRSTTGCTIWITRTNTTDTTVNWIAVN